MQKIRYRRENAEIAALLTYCNTPQTEIIRLLGITAECFKKWQEQHRSFREALNGPTLADRAEAALIKRALGFQINEESSEELIDKKSGELLEVLKKRTITKDVPPDVRALLFYLQNRHPERWCENKNQTFTEIEIPEEDKDL